MIDRDQRDWFQIQLVDGTVNFTVNIRTLMDTHEKLVMSYYRKEHFNGAEKIQCYVLGGI